MRTEMEGSRRQNILTKLENRMELLNKLGISYLSGSVMRELEQAYGHAFAGMRQGRGVQSREADLPGGAFVHEFLGRWSNDILTVKKPFGREKKHGRENRLLPTCWLALAAMERTGSDRMEGRAGAIKGALN